MGCDIHLIIQYKIPTGYTGWDNFGGRIRLKRDYNLFGRLCRGVRSDFEDAPEGRELPVDIEEGLYLYGEFIEFIGDPEDSYRDEIYITEEEAARRNCEILGLRRKYVLDSDLHHFSWLTYAEYSDIVLEHTVYPEYTAVVAAMRILSDAGHDCRVVFAFDN